MKEIDAALFSRIERIQTTELRRALADLRTRRDALQNHSRELQRQLSELKNAPDIGRFASFVAQQCQKNADEDRQLADAEELMLDRLRDSVREEKKIEILDERLQKERMKRRQKYAEEASEMFTIFKYHAAREEGD